MADYAARRASIAPPPLYVELRIVVVAGRAFAAHASSAQSNVMITAYDAMADLCAHYCGAGGAVAIGFDAAQQYVPRSAALRDDRDARRQYAAVAAEGMAYDAAAVSVAVEISVMAIRGVECGVAQKAVARGIGVFDPGAPRSAALAPRAPGFDTGQGEIFRRQATRLVLAHHLRIERIGRVEQRRLPAHIESAQLIAGFVGGGDARGAGVVAAEQQVAEGAQIFRPTLPAPLRRARKADLQRGNRTERDAHPHEQGIGHVAIMFELADAK